MFKQVVLFSCLLIAFQASANIYDIAEAELKELRQLVEGSILSAENELETEGSNIAQLGVDTVKSGEVEIQRQFETIVQELDSLIEIAHTAEADISPCLNGTADFLRKLPEVIGKRLGQCIQGHLKEAGRILQSSFYLVNLTSSRVDELETELSLCTPDSILCISPIVSQIGVELVELPEKIKTEVVRSKQLVSTLEVSIEDCSETNVARFTSDSTSILSEITQCANKIIG